VNLPFNTLILQNEMELKSRTSHIKHKIIEIKRLQKCRYDELCKKPSCKFIHPSRGEKSGDFVRSELKTIDLTKTKVCYFLDLCPRKKMCKFAHSMHELQVPQCKFGHSCKYKETCPRQHLDTFYDFSKVCFLFHEMKMEIIFDQRVIPYLLSIFKELGFLTFDVEKLIISFFPVLKN
jgi:hypothetical protein